LLPKKTVRQTDKQADKWQVKDYLHAVVNMYSGKEKNIILL